MNCNLTNFDGLCSAPILEAKFVEHSAAIWSLDMEENEHLAISRGEDGNLNSKPPQALILHCKPLLSNLRQKP
jgi:hypothetical protein